MTAYPFPQQFVSSQSPSVAQVTSPIPFGSQFNPRQSISLSAVTSPFQFSQQSPQGWPNPLGFSPRNGSPSVAALNGLISPQTPFDNEGYQPGLQRTQPLQYPLLPDQQLQQHQQSLHGNSALLERLDTDEETEHDSSPTKPSEPQKHSSISLQTGSNNAEYHLEESLRSQLEHEDYNPQEQSENPVSTGDKLTKTRDRKDSSPVPENFANDQEVPLVLHHPRPHSRGQSLSRNFFRDHNDGTGNAHEGNSQGLEALDETGEQQKGSDDSQEIETNPSDLGTPVQNFDFSAAFEQHQRSVSKASNSQNSFELLSGHGSRRNSHGRKPSLSSKLNVQAPEFKFNPTSNFTPGMFNFSGPDSQPTVFPPRNDQTADSIDLPHNVPLSGSSHFDSKGPSFNMGNSAFAFSTEGLKFRPDAPAFMPFQPMSGSVTSGGGERSNRNSIFSNIDVSVNDMVKPTKKSRAIPIVRPSNTSSVKAHILSSAYGDPQDDVDGQYVDEARVKRARSTAADADEEPEFANQDEEIEAGDQAKSSGMQPGIEDASAEGEGLAPADTSISSIASPDLIDTKATTAAPSESSPAQQNMFSGLGFDLDSKFEPLNPEQSGREESALATAEQLQHEGPPEGIGQESQKEDPFQASPVRSPVSLQPVSRMSAHLPSSPPLAGKGGLGPIGLASPQPKPKGLAASRFAAPAIPEAVGKEDAPRETAAEAVAKPEETSPSTETLGRIVPENLCAADGTDKTSTAAPPQPSGQAHEAEREMTFEEIDAVMHDMEHDPSKGVNKAIEASKWQALVPSSPPISPGPPVNESMPRTARSIPPQYYELPVAAGQHIADTDLEDPFLDPPYSPRSSQNRREFDESEHQGALMSDWEAAFSEDEHEKLESRAQFFDGRVNEVVGSLLSSRLEPLERALFSIQNSLVSHSLRPASSRRDGRSISAELRESDADDEDDEPPPRRSLSPRKDRRMEQIRIAVAEAFATQQHQRDESEPRLFAEDSTRDDSSIVLKALADLKMQLGTVMGNFSGDHLKVVIEQAVQNQIPPSRPDIDQTTRIDGLQARIMDLEDRLQAEQSKVEREVADRRAADDASAELNRKLQAAETRVEVEIINRSVYDQRVADLEEKLRHLENQSEEETRLRRAAEDRLSEVQRLLRISSEEENRLREEVEERQQRIKDLELSSGKAAMDMALLEAAQSNSSQSQSEMTNKINTLEADLKAVRQDNSRWRAEAEQADETARRKGGELVFALDESKHLQKTLNTLATQLEENERLRESWRAKFMSLQEDMAKAAREVAEENARRIKRDQAMHARHEVLDARLQAEAKTRERLEVEMERLQAIERDGMRAVNESKRYDGLLGELRTENYKLQQEASRYRRECEETKEFVASEVKRVRRSLENEVAAANHQVNTVRDELEDQNSKLRNEIDNIRLEIDTAKAHGEMLLEEAENTRKTQLEEAHTKHQNEMEDVSAKFERQLSDALEDGQKIEQHLLERLSLSSSRVEHLQDRCVHLEERLELAKQAAAAAAQAAKSAGVESAQASAPVIQDHSSSKKLDLPEKISPQALRESIMVLQEQLQAREQRIEELEQLVAKSDPDAATKISKRDDEIIWLRELLAVRHGDLQDVITALSGDSYDRSRVRDAAIRLKAGLQMEEQERDRATNGASAINLPNIAQSIQSATPRVAQTIGAAWGNWRKGSSPSIRSISDVLASPPPQRGGHATPPRSNPSSANHLLDGLLTPPASGLRPTPTGSAGPQPTAFSATGRRYPSQGITSSRLRGDNRASARGPKMAVARAVSPHEEVAATPQTPPMMRSNSYDSDAQPGDFDDQDFFDED